MILIVEDDADTAELLGVVLEMYGLPSAVAEDAPSALDGIEHGNYGLVLLDLTVPGLPFPEFIRRLETLRDGRTVPILIHSARPKSEIMSLTANVGANGFLQKPATVEVLLETIRGLYHP